MSKTSEYLYAQAVEAGFDPHDAEQSAAYRPNTRDWTPPVVEDVATAPFEVQDEDGYAVEEHWTLQGAQQAVIDGEGYQIVHWCAIPTPRLTVEDSQCPQCGAR